MKKYLEVVHLDSVKSRNEFFEVAGSLDKKAQYTFRDEDGWEFLCVGELFSAGTWSIVMIASSGQSIATIAEDELPCNAKLKNTVGELYRQLETSAELNAQAEVLLLKALAVSVKPSAAFKEL